MTRVPQRTLSAKKAAPLAIVILDRGWVFIGRVRSSSKQSIIENAACIRRWGTTKGIGQLALEGPQPDTALDEAGQVTVPQHAVIAVLRVEESVWPGR